MRYPVPAGYFLTIELHLFVNGPAERMHHCALHGAPQTLWIDYETAVVTTHKPLCPHMTGLAVHFDFGNLGSNGLAAEGVGDASPGQDVSLADRLWRRTAVPAISFRGCLEYGNRARALRVTRIGPKQLQTEFQRVGLRRCRQLVDERFRCECRLWA